MQCVHPHVAGLVASSKAWMGNVETVPDAAKGPPFSGGIGRLREEGAMCSILDIMVSFIWVYLAKSVRM